MTPKHKTTPKRKRNHEGDQAVLYGNAPFKITYAQLEKSSKKRKSNSGGAAAPEPFVLEPSPYDKSLDLEYRVDRTDKHKLKDFDEVWLSPLMRRYNKIQVEENLYKVGDLVYVNTGTRDVTSPIVDWVAHILECRALSKSHVYLRVLWLYRPEDVPGGRQPFHGASEVIPSNHMEIIDASTINSKVSGIHRLEEGGGPERPEIPPGDLFYRTIYNALTAKATQPVSICVCKQPDNPDDGFIICENPACRSVMHPQCVLDDIMRHIYAERVLGQPLVDVLHEPSPTHPRTEDTAGPASPGGLLGLASKIFSPHHASASPAPGTPASPKKEPDDDNDNSLLSKTAASLSEVAASVVTPSSPTSLATPKRGRGRPPKHPKPTSPTPAAKNPHINLTVARRAFLVKFKDVGDLDRYSERTHVWVTDRRKNRGQWATAQWDQQAACLLCRAPI